MYARPATIVGIILAFYISAFVAHNTVPWVILQTLLGWLYIVYFLLITYVFA